MKRIYLLAYISISYCVMASGMDDFEKQKEDLYNALQRGDAVTTQNLIIENKNLTNAKLDNLEKTPLMVAIDRLSIYPSLEEVINVLFRIPAIDINATDSNNITALVLASFGGHLDIVQKLVNKNVKLDVQTNTIFFGYPSQSTALMIALETEKLEIARFLIENGANTSLENSKKETAQNIARRKKYQDIINLINVSELFTAIKNGDLDKVKDLINKGSDINIKFGPYNATPLIKACISNKKEIAQFLLEKKPDINATDSNGWTALIHASWNGNADIVDLLLKKNLDLDMQTTQEFGLPEGSTALMAATKKEYNEIVKNLIEKGAKITIKNDKEQTALDIAYTSKNQDTISLLQTKSFFNAVRNKDIPTIIDLLDRHVPVDIRDSVTNSTPLISAAAKGYNEILELLLNKGASIDTQDRYGRTALIMATLNGYAETVKLLLEKNANKTITTTQEISGLPVGSTALNAAEQKKYENIEKILKAQPYDESLSTLLESLQSLAKKLSILQQSLAK